MQKGVAVVGCGAIGSLVAKAIDEGIVTARLEYLFDLDRNRAKNLLDSLSRQKPRIASRIDEILSDPKVDIVVESASQQAVKEYLHPILKSGKSVLVLSVGALLDPPLKKLYEEHRDKIHIPAGAIAGLDAVEALTLAGIDKIELTTRKHPKQLAYSRYFKKRGLSPENITEPLVVFEGSAEEAVRVFPRSLNIAATLKLLSRARVQVKLLADPCTKRNIHEIKIYSKASIISIKVENVPHPLNRKTSYLAALSAVNTLRKLTHST